MKAIDTVFEKTRPMRPHLGSKIIFPVSRPACLPSESFRAIRAILDSIRPSRFYQVSTFSPCSSRKKFQGIYRQVKSAFTG